MKVCFITDSYPPNIGGAEIAIQNIAEGIYKKGIDVIIITTRARENFTFHSQIPDSKIIRIRTPKFLHRLCFLIFSIPVTLVKCKDVNILHGTSYGGVLQAYIVGKLLRKPAVVTIHEFMGEKWKRFAPDIFSTYLFWYAEKLFARLSFSKFIAVSEYSKKTLLETGVKEEKVVVIHNGESDFENQHTKSKSEIRNELNLPENKFIFAAYGRTGLTKGFEFLVDAIPYVLKQNNNSLFILILSTGNKKLWKKIINSISLMDPAKVLFYSSLDRGNLIKYLNASDVIIIPSLSEGFGFTTLEACLLGKIVLASNAGSIPEVIYGKNILITPGSSQAIVDGCADAANGLYKNTEIKKFAWDESMNSYVKVYKEIIN